MKFLDEMKKIIPFDQLVSILIEVGIYKTEIGKKGGTCKDTFGVWFLQNWYSLSDPIVYRTKLNTY